MRCPFCGNNDTQVKDSRPTEDNATIRRRRYCVSCGSRFTTFERVHLRELTVVKSDGEKVPFDREKVKMSMEIALRKRPVKEGQIELIVNSIQRHLETSGETEIPSKAIGKLIMDRLMDMDKVAYVRFASVYKDFHEINDFNEFIGTLGERNGLD